VKSTIAICSLVTGLVAFAEGCSDSSGASPGCPRTVAQQCAMGDPPAGQFGVHCAPTLAAAEKDPTFCGGLASESTCGAYTVVTATNVDFSYVYYYDAAGALVAIASNGLVKGLTCLAGDGAFAFPTATCSDPRRLPACAVP